MLSDTPFAVVCFDEERIRIAAAKLRLDPFTTLHIDTTSGVCKKINNVKEVYYSMASFAGRDERTELVADKLSENHPPFVVADFISDKTTTFAYKMWLSKIQEGLHLVAGGNYNLFFKN